MSEIKIKMLSLEQLLEMMENKESFKLVEVLEEKSYREKHLPSAINIPLSKLDELAEKMLNKDEKIVVYCASYKCKASTNAARRLLDLGFKNVYDFKGGKKLWELAGFSFEK